MRIPNRFVVMLKSFSCFRSQKEIGEPRGSPNCILQPFTVGEAAAVLKPLSAPYELTTTGACADPQVLRLASYLETEGRMLGLWLNVIHSKAWRQYQKDYRSLSRHTAMSQSPPWSITRFLAAVRVVPVDSRSSTNITLPALPKSL